MLAPAKVNLCLFLGPTRASDGRHQLVTLFESLSLADELSVEFGVAADEVICPGVAGPNLAMDALIALRAAGWSAPPLRVTIAKRIPVAAGMAGGSADAAAVLRLGADMPWEQIQAIAAGLGADVPSQLEPGLAVGTGAGERVSPASALADHAFVVLPSAQALSTAEVYRESDRLALARSPRDLQHLETLLRQSLAPGVRLVPELIINDLSEAALSLCPSIQSALDALLDVGAEQAIVSGSGPTTVGIWWGTGARSAAERAATTLSAYFPGAQVAVPFASSSQFDVSA